MCGRLNCLLSAFYSMINYIVSCRIVKWPTVLRIQCNSRCRSKTVPIEGNMAFWYSITIFQCRELTPVYLLKVTGSFVGISEKSIPWGILNSTAGASQARINPFRHRYRSRPYCLTADYIPNSSTRICCGFVVSFQTLSSLDHISLRSAFLD